LLRALGSYLRALCLCFVKSTGFVEMLRKCFKFLSLVFFMDRASRLRKAVQDGETGKVKKLLDRG
jgi:hypothetical protein